MHQTDPASTSTRGNAPRHRWRWWGVWLLFMVLLLEGAARIGHRAIFGTWSIDREAIRGDVSTSGATSTSRVDAGGLEGGAIVPHPYLGYALSPSQAASWLLPVNREGLRDSADLVRKRSPDTLLVGITGGSVALQTSVQGEALLQKQLAHDGRRVEIVRLCIGGYKQPQQLAALAWLLTLGGELDLLINLDGFNEVALPRTENVRDGIHPLFPRSYGRLMSGVPDASGQLLLGRVALARDVRSRWQERFSGTISSRSATAQLAWRLFDRRYARDEARALQALADAPPADASIRSLAAIPSEYVGDEMLPAVAQSWRRASIAIEALCAAHGIRYYHFLQPNQYDVGSKPIGTLERRRAIVANHPYATDVPVGYRLLRTEASALWEAGVRYFDLSLIFANDPTPRYIDNCCHLDDEGGQLVATEIARCIMENIAADADALVDLAFDDDVVRLDRPGWSEAPHLFGRFESGVTRDVTHPSFGTRYAIDDAAIAEVTRDGKLRPRAAGRTWLTVDLSGRSTRLEILSTVALTGIRVDPEVIRLDDPTQTIPLQVFALVGGDDVNVTDERETTFRSSDASVAWLDSTRVVSARGVGFATIEVGFDRYQVSVPVESTLGPFTLFGNGVAGKGGHVPRLDFTTGNSAPTGGDMPSNAALIATDVCPNSAGLLAIADAPERLQITAGDEPIDPSVTMMPVQVNADGRARISIPIKLSERFSGNIVFVRGIFRDAAANGGFSATQRARLVFPKPVRTE